MADDTATPMMAQYLAIKAEHPDALLFYRMGDFYEMFFDDAVAAAEALDIALTRRGTHLGEAIRMCGVPVHAAEGYLLTLIRKGFRVAIAEQMEDPAEARKRGAKSVVRREVVRLVTPGTLTEDTLLDARRHNYLLAFAEVREEAALAWADISTGMVTVMDCPAVRLGPELARLAPREVILSETATRVQEDAARDAGAAVTRLSPGAFDSTAGERRLCGVYGVASLEAFGQFARAEIAALSALTEYVALTQKGAMPLLRPPRRESAAQLMQIDGATRRSLELVQAAAGGRAGSLLATIDRTVTAGGGRLLERRLSAPSCRIDVIRDRLESVSVLADSVEFRDGLRDHLRRAHDLERALSRLALDRGGPRDMAAIRNTLGVGELIARMVQGHELSPLLMRAATALHGHDPLLSLLDEALVAEPPLLARDGGFVAPGFDPDLDDARRLRDEGRQVIAAMQADYIAETGIQSLKIRHNNVLGYFIETTETHAARMMSPPLSARFIHRQTTANQLRFTTAELSETEARILNAGDRALEIERRVFAALRERILAQAGPLAQVARSLAELDLTAALADLARTEDWCRPQVDDSRAFAIAGGRHPVVESALRRAGQPFVVNDCDLGADPIWLLTGPNMAGKSTFLRQNALIAVLAQMGSFVPAGSAQIGLVSQIFSRVGASDDLARGRSTFMVEMVETAAILNQADDRALVILDEIGRGTATWDGLSIAWATLEHLHHTNRCRAIFATHYHELAQLADRLDGVANATVTVKDWQGEVVFLHEVRRGTADRSYGVQVARLAGLPASVVERARDVLETLEKGEREGGSRVAGLIEDLPLFAAAALPATPPPAQPRRSVVEDRLRALHPDMLTPREALDLIYELKGLTDAG
ncbi:MAG: DNA mismatch repair protein MutS [Rubellimicrobium sp.]|nr:DNA mismatch repair protein MutS [Rubellimicrobium sp.]